MKKELDPNEILPFCMRCFGVGISADEESNFCHQCGSQGTCVPMKRKDIVYLRENIEDQITYAKKYTTDDCIKDTTMHINQVKENIIQVVQELLNRANNHDRTKLMAPEVQIFTEYTPKLAGCTYGSKEYNRYLKEMKKALDHHYEVNRHHPEHFENGINDMTLIDLIEMLCDWMAAVKRHDDGDICESLAINKKRFGISKQLSQILENTVRALSDKDGK